jgi:hypothetical protein
MTGNDRRGLVLQERDKRLFRELATMRVIDREQAKTVARFGSTTRANARLLALTRAKLLRRFNLGTTAGGRKALYALSANSASLLGVPNRGPRRSQDEPLVADFFIQHQLVINETYCAVKFSALPSGVAFGRWQAFYEPLTADLRLIPDGYVELQTPSGVVAAFLEVDLGNETMSVWKEKVRNYLRFALSGDSERMFKQNRFRVLVVVNSERRLRGIQKVIAASTEKIFWLASLQAIRKNGFFASVWFRPTGNESQFLVPIT